MAKEHICIVSTKREEEERERRGRTEVHAARRHVRREEDAALGDLERLGGGVALALRLARVDLVRVEPGRELLEADALEQGGDEAGRARGREEDHGLGGRVEADLLAQEGERLREDVEERRREERELGDGLVRVLLVVRDRRHELEALGEVDGAELVHLGRDRRREHERLARRRLARGEVRDDALAVLAEALLEEAVGLVEDERAQARQLGLEAAVLQVVEEAAGRRDEEVAALVVQPLGLGVHVGAADDVLHLELGAAEERLGALLNLDGELARRREDEDRDGALGRLGRCAQQVLDRRDEEGERLARARAGLRETVDRRGGSESGRCSRATSTTRERWGGREGGGGRTRRRR